MYESSALDIILASQYIIFLAIYLYSAICLYYIARKTGHAYPWWAFIPILNLWQMVQLANQPWYWFVLCFVPFINLVALVVIWLGIARAREKSPVWAVLMLIPFLNFISLAVLAAGPSTTSGIKTYEERPQRQPVNVG